MKPIRNILLLSICIVYSTLLTGQVNDSLTAGRVSYVTTQSIYVKFESTGDISPGDTLFIKRESNLVPALQVKNLSSISCVCIPLGDLEISVSDAVFYKHKLVDQSATTDKPEVTEVLPSETDTVSSPRAEDQPPESPLQQQINGRLSVSSYTNFSNTPSGGSQRMRYTFSLSASNIANSRLSAETYISFVHKNDNWDDIRDNLFNGLKIYNLALKYDFSENTQLILGRKINQKISNIGVVDGLQFNTKVRSFYFGAIAGSRPNYSNYGYDFKLFQVGAYAAHELATKNGNMQTTLAFVQQMNDWNTDRRFLYLQHTNYLVKNLFFFGTMEFNLFKASINPSDSTTLDGKTTFDLSNLYFSLRYRVTRQLSFSLSYSNRQNIIYYETYKNYLERLLESEALQGYRFQVNYRPIRFLSVGVTAGYRYRKSDPEPSINGYAYITYSRIPVLNLSATLSVTLLRTSYLNGKIYSVGLSRDLVPGKLYAGIAYRNINYDYLSSDNNSMQNVGEVNLSWNIYRKLSFSVYYEGTFDESFTYNRIYANLTQRF